MFLAAARYFEIPVERVAIPFFDKAIVGHLRLPKKLPAPLVMHWGGIDNWKEERHAFAESFGDHKPARATVIAKLVNPDFLVEIVSDVELP